MTFQPGKSGNPSGRPKGMRDRRTIFRDMIEPYADRLIKTSIKMAIDGNEQMLKLLLDRLLPPKPREETVDICLKSDSLVEQSKKIIHALADGDISIAEANKLMQAIATEAKIYEFESIKEEVEELKKLVKNRKN